MIGLIDTDNSDSGHHLEPERYHHATSSTRAWRPMTARGVAAVKAAYERSSHDSDGGVSRLEGGQIAGEAALLDA